MDRVREHAKNPLNQGKVLNRAMATSRESFEKYQRRCVRVVE